MLTKTRETKTQSQTKKDKPLFSAASLGLFAFWLVISVLVVEGVLYFAGIGEEEVCRLDKEIGLVHMRDKRITWRSEGYSISYFDSNGLREPNITVAKPNNTYRIVLLGDSMTETLQVPLEKSFAQLMEKTLNKSKLIDKKIQVLNFGCSGYATCQEYLLLRREALKFQPDLVITFYSYRDIFENWSPPDQILANVRPIAVHFPGQKLVVDSGPVGLWMKTPRGKFLTSIPFIRQNSHIWGVIAKVEQELGFHNPIYKNFILLQGFFSHPKATIQNFVKVMQNDIKNEYFKETPKAASKVNDTTSASNTTSTEATQKQSDDKLKEEDKGAKTYRELVGRTLHSLIAKMNEACKQSNAEFAVVILPSRNEIDGTGALQGASINYGDEQAIVNSICKDENIPLLNCQDQLKKLTKDEAIGMYHSVHLNQSGNNFMANCLSPFVSQLLTAKPQQ